MKKLQQSYLSGDARLTLPLEGRSGRRSFRHMRDHSSWHGHCFSRDDVLHACSDFAGKVFPLATILVVEKDFDSGMLAKRVLERCGHVVIACADGKAAGLWTSENRVDLVVVDINQSDPSSARLAGLLKRMRSRLRALGITNPGTELPEHDQWDALVLKPIDIDVLERNVRNLLESC